MRKSEFSNLVDWFQSNVSDISEEIEEAEIITPKEIIYEWDSTPF